MPLRNPFRTDRCYVFNPSSATSPSLSPLSQLPLTVPESSFPFFTSEYWSWKQKGACLSYKLALSDLLTHIAHQRPLLYATLLPRYIFLFIHLSHFLSYFFLYILCYAICKVLFRLSANLATEIFAVFLPWTRIINECGCDYSFCIIV